MRRQRTAIAGLQFTKPLTPITMEWLVAERALREQQTFNPINVLDALGGQRFAFTAKPTTIFVLRRRRHDHCADAWPTPFVRQQRPYQCLAVDPVSLSPPSLTRGRNRSCIDDVTLDLFTFKNTMNSEAIQTRLLNDNNRYIFPGSLKDLQPSRDRRASSAGISPADTTRFDIFSPPPGDIEVISHVDRLSSNEAKTAPSLVRIAIGSSRP